MNRKVFLVLILLMVFLGVALRRPDPKQGLTADEQLLLDRSFDLLQQLGLEKGIRNYEPFYDLNAYRYVSYNGTSFPFNISIKAHHPGYFPVILTAAAMRLFLKDGDMVSRIIQLRWIQSVVLIFYAVFIFYLLVYKLKFSPLVSLLFPLFILTEPLLLGESRMIKQDVLLTVFLSSAIILFYAYLTTGKRSYVLLSGTLAGIASAVKIYAFPFVALSLLFLLFELWKTPEGRERSLLPFPMFVISAYVAFLMFSPNIWSHPFSGVSAVFSVAKASPQISQNTAPLLLNCYYFLRIFTHISALVVACLFLCSMTLYRSPARENIFLATSIMGMLLMNFFIAIKDPRYILPAIPVIVMLSLPSLEYLEGRYGKKIGLLSVGSILGLHIFSFAYFNPYLDVYTWEFLKYQPVVPYERLDRSIMAPQIADYLKANGIGEVLAITCPTLRYYYDGRILQGGDSPWRLISQKYFQTIPAGYGEPYKVFEFRGQTIYRLYEIKNKHTDSRYGQH